MSLSPTEKHMEINEPLFERGTRDNYMMRSLLAVLLCCPFGLVALYHSFKVNRLQKGGEEEAAKRASYKAITYSSWAFLGALMAVIIFATLVMGGIVFLICLAIDWEKR